MEETYSHEKSPTIKDLLHDLIHRRKHIYLGSNQVM